MSAETGGNATLHGYWISEVLSGGATVKLFTTGLSYQDTATELDTKEVSAASYSGISVTDADFIETVDATNGRTTLENDGVIDFGTAGENWGIVVDAAIQNDANPDRFIRIDEPNDPEITQGEDVQFSSGDLSYTLGN